MDNSYPTSPFKGLNIVDLHIVCKQLLDGHKPCKTILSLTQCQRERLTGLTSILYLAELQYCNDGQKGLKRIGTNQGVATSQLGGGGGGTHIHAMHAGGRFGTSVE